MHHLSYTPYEDIKPETVGYYYVNRATGVVIPNGCPDGIDLPMVNATAPPINTNCGY